MAPVQAVTVFCGSSLGTDPRFEEAAKTLGKCLADQQIELIYGGGNSGLMGTLSRTVRNNGGKVTGILPEFFLEKFPDILDDQTLVVVPDMHARKQMMLEKADAFIALPGGFGTAEELLEMITWKQLGLHQKPVGILNVAGYYDKLLEWVSHSVNSGFIHDVAPSDASPYPWKIFAVTDNPEELLQKLSEFSTAVQNPES